LGAVEGAASDVGRQFDAEAARPRSRPATRESQVGENWPRPLSSPQSDALNGPPWETISRAYPSDMNASSPTRACNQSNRMSSTVETGVESDVIVVARHVVDVGMGSTGRRRLAPTPRHRRSRWRQASVAVSFWGLHSSGRPRDRRRPLTARRNAVSSWHRPWCAAPAQPVPSIRAAYECGCTQAWAAPNTVRACTAVRAWTCRRCDTPRTHRAGDGRRRP
jgi:hypothetical protein